MIKLLNHHLQTVLIKINFAVFYSFLLSGLVITLEIWLKWIRTSSFSNYCGAKFWKEIRIFQKFVWHHNLSKNIPLGCVWVWTWLTFKQFNHSVKPILLSRFTSQCRGSFFPHLFSLILVDISSRKLFHSLRSKTFYFQK